MESSDSMAFCRVTSIWKRGRQLASLTQDNVTWHFTYNADGIRTKRTTCAACTGSTTCEACGEGTSNATTYSYVYNGSSLSQMTVGENKLNFLYDANGAPMVVIYNGEVYYYVTNLQGDVIAILDSDGNAVVEYTYDAWGKLLATTGTLAATIGLHNPLRYRSYMYDNETALYYLQSRYYDPELGRFINADALASTGQGLLGHNMYAYCRNNPIMRKDALGSLDEDATDEASESPWSKFFSHMARQRKDGHTFSVGYVYSGLWGSVGAGKSGCIAVDNSYNYALQSTDSLSVGDGTGVSAGLAFTYTNADNVQDLLGASTSTGITLCGSYGIAVDFVEFTAATNPQKKCWGISVSILIGAQADVHKSESYTRSTPSWNPFKAALKRSQDVYQ